MKKNVLIALTVACTVAVAGVTVYAGSNVARKMTCPNCGTELEFEGRRGFSRGKRPEIKTLDELKTELQAKVDAGEITQEEMDKKIAAAEERKAKMEENMKKRPQRPEIKTLDELKTELQAKVDAGEITQEEMDKKIAQWETRYESMKNRFRMGGRRRGFGKGLEDKQVSERSEG